jgi:glycosyltransferase involved in cell wall biosynthesis
VKGAQESLPELRVLLRGPYPPPYGGVASLIVSLVEGLTTGHAADLVVLQFGDEDNMKVVGGARVYSVRVRSNLWRLGLPKNWPLALRVLTSLAGAQLGVKELLHHAIRAVVTDHIAERHASNVVAFYQSDLSLELLACSRTWRGRRGVALKVFGEIYDSPEFVRSRAGLFQKLLSVPDVVTASSRHCARSFEALGVERKVEVVYVGVNLDRFVDDGGLRTRYREEMVIGVEVPLLLFLGRFNQRMGLDSLIDLVPRLVESGEAFRMVLAGATGELTSAALACQKAFPGYVTVMNDVPMSVLPGLYAAADIVLAPSRDQHACMGVTIKEAMAAGRAVVGSNSGGIPEAVAHGETGLVVPLNSDGSVDLRGMEAALLKLMRDPQRRAEMGLKARVLAAERFSERVTVERTAEILRRCIPGG